jgi:C4-dicarboxylate-specific signal transduction histidine kinase
MQRDTRAQDGVVDLRAFVQRIIRLRGYAVREQGITLHVEIGAGGMSVRVDPRRLETAIVAAMRHAELASHAMVNRGISIVVREADDRFVAVDIMDSGVGDSPDLTPRYFDTAGDGSRTRASASEPPDLGLVASFLRAAGGRLDVKASKAAGTTLTLVLPKAIVHNSSHTGDV